MKRDDIFVLHYGDPYGPDFGAAGVFRALKDFGDLMGEFRRATGYDRPWLSSSWMVHWALREGYIEPVEAKCYWIGDNSSQEDSFREWDDNKLWKKRITERNS